MILDEVGPAGWRSSKPQGSTAAGRAWPSDRIHFCWKNGPFPWDEAIGWPVVFGKPLVLCTATVWCLCLGFVRFSGLHSVILCHSLLILVFPGVVLKWHKSVGASSWSCCWRDGDSFSKRANGLVLGMMIPHRLHIFCQVPEQVASALPSKIQAVSTVGCLPQSGGSTPNCLVFSNQFIFFHFLSAWWSLTFSILFHSVSKSPSSNFLRLVWCRPAVKLWFASLKRMGNSPIWLSFLSGGSNVVLTVEWYSYFLNDASNTRVNLVNGKHQTIQGTVPLQLWTCSGIGMSTTSPPFARNCVGRLVRRGDWCSEYLWTFISTTVLRYHIPVDFWCSPLIL